MPSERIDYHLGELEVATSPDDKDHNLPCVRASDKAILDIGCGVGQILIGLDIAKDPERLLIGIDVDIESMAYGRENFDFIDFAGSNAESLPFVDDSFDLVFSRVSLPYTNIPVTLKEISRVLKPGGHIWISMHPQRMTWRQLTGSLRAGLLKAVVFRCYVLANGFALRHLDRVFAWPSFLHGTFNQTKKKYESFQTETGMQRLLQKEGFERIQFVKDRHFVVSADLPSLVKIPAIKPSRDNDLPDGKLRTKAAPKPIPETLN